jgi:hypothetical protein
LECANHWWGLTFKSVNQILRQKKGHENFGMYEINLGNTRRRRRRRKCKPRKIVKEY